MKATITYECELEEIPTTISQLLSNVRQGDVKELGTLLEQAIEESQNSQEIGALKSIDQIRHLLARIDKKLMDCASILGGYIKAQVDLKAGVSMEDLEEQLEKIGEEPIKNAKQKVKSND